MDSTPDTKQTDPHNVSPGLVIALYYIAQYELRAGCGNLDRTLSGVSA